jgi:hypothetical protein
VFSSPTSVNLDRPFVVFGVRDLEPELRPLGVYLIAEYLWREVRRRRVPRMLLIDEAWQLVQHEEGARFLAAMARQARKYYLGLTTVTQDVGDFLATPEGHTVLANSSAQLLMRQDASSIDVVAQTFRLSAGEREFLLGCGKGEGLFFAGGNHIALRIVASPPSSASSASIRSSGWWRDTAWRCGAAACTSSAAAPSTGTRARASSSIRRRAASSASAAAPAAM